MRRLRDEDGFTMIAVMATIIIVILFSGAALAVTVRRVHTSMRDRQVAQAQAAADAAADVAGWRMNRSLFSATGDGLLGTVSGDLRQLACTDVGVGSFKLLTVSQTQAQGNPWCAFTPWESEGDGASFRYSLSLDLTALSGLSNVIVRRVIAEGRSGAETRRVMVTYKMDLTASHVTKLWKRWRYIVCTAQPDLSRADGGCPDPGT
jgi:type II secretory pathway pseudopilin PulG